MKPIDTAEVIKILNKYGRYVFASDEARYNKMVEEITSIPAVEVKPIAKGKWILKEYGIGCCSAECSVCGNETDGTAEDNGWGWDYTFPNFCPNCGADMREDMT